MSNNPEVQHGSQPAVNPQVVVNGPLGETSIRPGGESTTPPEPGTDDPVGTEYEDPGQPDGDEDEDPDTEDTEAER